MRSPPCHLLERCLYQGRKLQGGGERGTGFLYLPLMSRKLPPVHQQISPQFSLV